MTMTLTFTTRNSFSVLADEQKAQNSSLEQKLPPKNDQDRFTSVDTLDSGFTSDGSVSMRNSPVTEVAEPFDMSVPRTRKRSQNAKESAVPFELTITPMEEGTEQVSKVEVQEDEAPLESIVQKTSSLTVAGNNSGTLPVMRRPRRPAEDGHEELEEAPLPVLITTYLGYLILILFGHIRDFFGKIFRKAKYAHLKEADGYAPLTSDFESFYTRRLYTRIRDCWNRPITGVPGRTLHLLERKSDDYNNSFRLLGTTREVLNLSSYNYLGFAQNEGLCSDEVEISTLQNGVGVCSPRLEAGTMEIHQRLEKLVARFLGKVFEVLLIFV